MGVTHAMLNEPFEGERDEKKSSAAPHTLCSQKQISKQSSEHLKSFIQMWMSDFFFFDTPEGRATRTFTYQSETRKCA